MSFYEDLPIPSELTGAGIDRAIVAARKSLLRGDLSRFGFAVRAYRINDLRAVPFGHLLEHRLRGLSLKNLASGASGEMAENLEALLWRMLNASDRTDARELVADALRVDPTSDARALTEIVEHDVALGRLLLQGRLGSAIRHIDVHTPEGNRRAELTIVSRLLLYFSCFSVQLVATRAWLLEHPPWRDQSQKGAYRIAGFVSDLHEVADVIGQIGAYARGK